ncbi:MAG: GIY-YIG nuclease family protein [Planctomycetes bacterium]|nr:GIY-YIG nuclease family protein [Planctomycetota bacterium]
MTAANLAIGSAEQTQDHAGDRLSALLALHLAVLRKSALKRINADNFTSVKVELERGWEAVERIRVDVPAGSKEAAGLELRRAFEDAVRHQLVREDQARIKERIRQEERLAAEARKAVEQAERDQRALKQALEIALRQTANEHSVEIEELRQRLAEAESRGARALSMAQQTKAGHVYIISNIGSLGEGVFKIGMTRRLDPLDRVWELSDASVPFPFDVHALVQCKDAPALEHALHTAFNHQRLNKVNLRKEFFRADLAAIMQVVERTHGSLVEYQIAPEAAEFIASRDVKDEDLDYAAALTGESATDE